MAAGSRCYLSSTSLTLPSPFSNTKHSILCKEISSKNTKEIAKNINEISEILDKFQTENNEVYTIWNIEVY